MMGNFENKHGMKLNHSGTIFVNMWEDYKGFNSSEAEIN